MKFQFSHLIPTQNGTAHEGNKPFMLNYLSPKLEKYLKESHYLMAKIASSYFINFCISGDPNGDGLQRLEKFTKDRTYFKMGNNSGMRIIDNIQNKKVFDLLQKTAIRLYK